MKLIFLGFIQIALLISLNGITIGGLTFELYNGQYRLKHSEILISGTVIIPSEINGIAVTQIAYEAFRDCQLITELIIPNSVVKIESNAFYNCIKLSRLSIPQSVTNIGRGIITGSGVKRLEILGDIKELTWAAFINATNLETVFLPDNLEKINEQAFFGCTNLSEVNLSGRLSEPSLSNPDILETPLLGSMHLPMGLKEIQANAFGGCTSLPSNITIPDSVEKVGYKSFANSGISNVFISDHTDIYYNAFDGSKVISDNLGKIKLVELSNRVLISGIDYWEGFLEFNSKLIIPNSYKGKPITHIMAHAFAYENNISEIILSEALLNLGEQCFVGTGLTEIILPNSIRFFGEGVFSDCTELIKIQLPEKLKHLPDDTFNSCEKLEHINLPSSLETIGNHVFKNNKSLISIEIPKSVTDIGSAIFDGCTSLKEVVIPESVARIDIQNPIFKKGHAEALFSNTPNLTSVKIPNRFAPIFTELGIPQSLLPDLFYEAIIDCLLNDPKFIDTIIEKGLLKAPKQVTPIAVTEMNDLKSINDPSYLAKPDILQLMQGMDDTLLPLESNKYLGSYIEINRNEDFKVNFTIDISSDLKTWKTLSTQSIIIVPRDQNKNYLRLKIH